MGKGAFLGVYAATTLGTALVMLLVGWLLPRVPKSLVNLPNKDYWLAPQRKEATFACLSGYIAWCGCATLVLVIVCFHISFAATLGRQVPSWLFPWVLGVYVAFTLVWCVRLLWRFRKPKET